MPAHSSVLCSTNCVTAHSHVFGDVCAVLRRVLCSTNCVAAHSHVFGEFCAVLRGVLCDTNCCGTPDECTVIGAQVF